MKNLRFLIVLLFFLSLPLNSGPGGSKTKLEIAPFDPCANPVGWCFEV